MLRKCGLRLFLAVCFLSCAAAARSQEDLPAEALPFVAKGFVSLDYKAGDLNGDGQKDAILILKRPDEDSAREDETLRPLLLLIRQSNGKLKQVVRNDSLVMCRHCGGVFGDPYADLEISGNGFTIHFYGGSSWRWASSYRFDYKPAKKNWYLVKETQTTFQSGDPDGTMEEIEIGESELGELSATAFHSGLNFENSNWKVAAAKSYFFDQPVVGSKSRKAYVVKGNVIVVTRILKNFVYASFENDKNVITSGFLLKKDLLKIK